VKVGRLRALAVTGLKRAEAAPEVPTLHETALRGYEITSWFGIAAPAATPQDVLARLNRDFVRVMALPDVREKLASLGSESLGTSPAQFAAHLKAEQQKWEKVITHAGIRAE
jgi:tripartite-type tricarboxylate transporter receptor subunit TctC